MERLATFGRARAWADKKCRTVVPNRSAEGQRTEVNAHFSNG